MKRLNEINLNTPETHVIKEPNWFDKKRYRLLLKYYYGGKIIDLGGYSFLTCESFDWVPEKIPREDESYDYVIAGQLLEHLDDPAQYIKEFMRILKRGGTLALSVPLEETEAGEVDNIHHVWSFSEKDIKDLLESYGKVKIKIIGSRYFPYKYNFPHIIAWCQKYY